MTKKLIFGLAVTALLASCTEDFKQWSAPQSNPQTPLSIDGVTATSSPIDLETAGSSVQLFSMTNTTTGVCVLNSVIFDNAAGETATLATSDGIVAKADLDYTVKDLYGWQATPRTISATAISDYTSQSYTGKLASNFTANITPVATGYTVPQHMYVIGGLPGCSWDATSTDVPMTVDPNDPSVFTITFDVAASGDYWFALSDDETVAQATATGTWDYVLGTRKGNGKNSVGKVEFLGRRRDLVNCGDASFEVKTGAATTQLKITVNFTKGTYLFEEIQ